MQDIDDSKGQRCKFIGRNVTLCGREVTERRKNKSLVCCWQLRSNAGGRVGTRASGRGPGTSEGDSVAKNFKVPSGETLPECSLPYTTLAARSRCPGRVSNAVRILHGTGGTGHINFATNLAGWNCVDWATSRCRCYFHHPSRRRRPRKNPRSPVTVCRAFPHYDYDDMVQLITCSEKRRTWRGHLRLIPAPRRVVCIPSCGGETIPTVRGRR